MKYLASISVIIILLNSCGMNWDNGGEEEFRVKMIQMTEHEIRNNPDFNPDINKTCDCLINEARLEWPNYNDRGNKLMFFEAKINSCYKEK